MSVNLSSVSERGFEIDRRRRDKWRMPVKKYVGALSYRDPAELARFEKGLREAGLPE